MIQFPVALAILDLDGEPNFLNEQFHKSFEQACLTSVEIQDVLQHAGEGWRMLKLARRDGTEAWVQARSVRLHEYLLLVIEERLAGGADERLEGLRTRIAELERQGATDRLTGAWNRLHLDRVLKTELGRSERLRQPVTLVLVDIDYFKRVNDTYGHASGDQVLCELVQSMNARVRPGDLVFRWGGEEFLMLLSATGYRHAHALAEELRAAVEAHRFEGVGSLTISSGVAEHQPGESVEHWFRRVDEALYESKHAGRNRVTVDEHGGSDDWAASPTESLVQLQWQEAYESGQPLIDREHRELFQRANALLALSCQASRSSEDWKQALDELLSHIVQHFGDEESLLAQWQYAGLEGHRRAHQALLARARELRARAETGLVTLGELVDFIAIDIVANHLLKSDRQFFSIFRSGRIAARVPAGT